MVVKIVKIFLGLSLVLWAVWGHFQGGSLCFGFFSLLVSSVSDCHPGTKRAVVDTFFRLLFSRAVGREGCCKQITLACACSVSAIVGPPPLMVHVPFLHCSGSRLLTGNRSRLALGCRHLPGLSRSGSGTRVVLRCADSVGPAFCALPRSKQLR